MQVFQDCWIRDFIQTFLLEIDRMKGSVRSWDSTSDWTGQQEHSRKFSFPGGSGLRWYLAQPEPHAMAHRPPVPPKWLAPLSPASMSSCPPWRCGCLSVNGDHLTPPSGVSYPAWRREVMFGRGYVSWIRFWAVVRGPLGPSQAAALWAPQECFVDTAAKLPLTVSAKVGNLPFIMDWLLSKAPWRVSHKLKHHPPRWKHSLDQTSNRKGLEDRELKRHTYHFHVFCLFCLVWFDYSFMIKDWHWCGTTCKLFSVLFQGEKKKTSKSVHTTPLKFGYKIIQPHIYPFFVFFLCCENQNCNFISLWFTKII